MISLGMGVVVSSIGEWPLTTYLTHVYESCSHPVKLFVGGFVVFLVFCPINALALRFLPAWIFSTSGTRSWSELFSFAKYEEQKRPTVAILVFSTATFLVTEPRRSTSLQRASACPVADF